MSITLGLERIATLLKVLGNPHLRLQVIHVAGTNGKGSVCAYIDNILRRAGYRVGRFNSPHLLEARDSIRINGEALDRVAYQNLHDEIADACRRASLDASPFERLAAAAFACFERRQVEVAVVEVGMGGRLDATNVFPMPLLSVITSIAMDHSAFLGGTISAIAREKAGIMRHNGIVVIAPQREENARMVLEECAREFECQKYMVQPAVSIGRDGWAETTVLGGKKLSYPLTLHGKFQLENTATAVVALDCLRRTHASVFGRITDEHIVDGLRTTRWPGRLDWVCSDKFGKVLVDGAHNPAAAMALREFVDQELVRMGKKGGVKWIVGATQGKDVNELLQLLVREGDSLCAVGFSQPEGMPWIQCVSPEDITRSAPAGSRVNSAASLEEALATEAKEDDSMLVLCGSLYLVSDFYRLVGLDNQL
ncbi:uncharacterized protein VTP21DRAFT_3256 [Calcarisporiella thermophila]|uniref:uncharacterized protein n=1 Tax=Calcarisporiella thermophila TaxID=911321 RepID=UPI003743E3B8